MTIPQRVKEIFEAALDSTPGEREPLLTNLCADDDQLRTEVEALLAAHAESDGFLAGSPFGELALDSVPDVELIGRRIGVYELQSEIGQGGMATVYLAERTDDEFSQQVALKLVSPAVNAAEITRRFKQERQILASLDHPNIARLLDGGTTEEGWPYLVMEYIAGQPITDYCRERKLPLAERLRLFQSVCAAVAYAHRNLVIHRDIKPSNILVTGDGTAKLLDFGIAKVLVPDSANNAQPTLTGLRPMTPTYASPEQLREESVATTTDIYSLGVLLYELLAGAHPFDLKKLPLHEISRIVCEEEPTQPSAKAGQFEKLSYPATDNPSRLLRGDLDNIVLKSLRKNARQRYQTVEEFSQDISRHLAGETVSARPATLFYRTGKYVRRHKTGVIAAATALLLLLTGLFVTLRQNRQQRYQLYAAAMRQAGQDWAEGNLVEMDALLEAHRPGTASDKWRGFEWFALWKLLHTEKFTLHHQAWVPTVVYTPDGKTILTGSRDGRIEMWDARSGQSLGLLTIFSEGIYKLLISNDGKKLVTFGQFGRISIWDFSTRRIITDLPAIKPVLAYPAFSPDGTRIALKADDQPIRVYDTGSGQLVAEYFLPPKLDVPRTGPALYASDGRLFCLTRKDRQFELWDVKAGQAVSWLDPHSDDPLALTPYYPTGYLFSHDGQRLYLPTRDFRTRVWDIKSGKLLHAFTGHQNDVETPALSSDDKVLATGSDDKTLRLWDTETGKLLATVKNESQTFSPVFSPDNRYLAAVCMRAMRVKVWDVQQLLSAPTTLEGVHAQALSPNGKTILTDTGSKEPALHDSQTGQKIAGFSTAPYQKDLGANCVAFSADGKLLTIRRVQPQEEQTSLEVRETLTGKILANLSGHTGFINAAGFSPNGKTLATGGRSDQLVRLWDTDIWHERSRLSGHTDSVTDVAFSLDSTKLATSSYDETIKIWDAADGRELQTLRGHHAWVWQVKFSPDGKMLASAGWDYAIKLWDAATGRELRTLKGHANSVYTVAFSPDGKRLASGSDDRTVRIWDVQTGEQLATLHGHTGKVWQVFFTPDGQTLISSSEKETLLWRMATEAQVRARIGNQ